LGAQKRPKVAGCRDDLLAGGGEMFESEQGRRLARFAIFELAAELRRTVAVAGQPELLMTKSR
jgi:hypothetical protein